MNMRNIALFAAFGSAAMLLGAFGFQYLGDMPPCKMCIWQRWPHGIAAAVGVIMLFRPNVNIGMLLTFSAAILVTVGAVIAGYHAGVEQHWFPGPDSCTGLPDMGAGLSSASLWDEPAALCDQIPWSMFGLSMAAWNGIVSILLAGLWLISFGAGIGSKNISAQD